MSIVKHRSIGSVIKGVWTHSLSILVKNEYFDIFCKIIYRNRILY